MLSAGDRIGGYEVVTRLRAGGMAALYLARRAGAAGFSKHVAIKVIHDQLLSDEAFVRMFVDEAKLCARISHPNVVHVEELGEEDGRYYLVMEYVHGCSLADLLKELSLRKRRLSPALAVHIAIQLADGLHAAHETTDPDGAPLGVVHRDVSPQNVLLSYKGHVKLIDFGIAKARGQAHQTVGSSLKGKFRYMSPEQANGQPLDRRSDVYSLGVVLWELLAARNLFRAPGDIALLDMVRNPEVEPPSHYAPLVPPGLDAVVLAALAPDRARRIATAKELRRRLVAAMPEAGALDADLLAGLLGSVMTEQMKKDMQELPESVSGIVRPPSDPAVPSEQAAPEEDLADLHAQRTLTIEPAGVPAASPTGSEPGTPEPGTPPARRARWPLVAGVAAVVTVSAAALAIGTGAERPSEPAALESPPAASAEARPPEPEPAATAAPAPAAVPAPEVASPDDAGEPAGDAGTDAGRPDRTRPATRPTQTRARPADPADGPLLLDDEF